MFLQEGCRSRFSDTGALGDHPQLIEVARIRLGAAGEGVKVGTPVSLFATHLSGTPRNVMGRHYMVSRDGQRFLMDTLKEVALPFTVILNWKAKP